MSIARGKEVLRYKDSLNFLTLSENGLARENGLERNANFVRVARGPYILAGRLSS